MSTRRSLLPALTVALAALGAGPPAAPKPPDEYDAVVRFRIRAPRELRLDQFDAMIKYLESIGFIETPDGDGERVNPLDTEVERIAGSITSAKAGMLLQAPYVQQVLLAPAGFKAPDDPEAPVKVQLTLADGLPPDRQLVLWQQVFEKLDKLGFRNGLGYDHRGYTRMRGTIPSKRLDSLVKDVRNLPDGWLTPMTARADLPSPIRDRSPVRVIEVIPEPDTIPPAAPLPGSQGLPPPDRAFVLKIGSDVADLFTAAKDKPQRVEIILAQTPPDDFDRAWRAPILGVAPETIIEGRLGPIVTAVVASAQSALNLATLPEVTYIRTPRSGEARPQPAPPAAPTGSDPMKLSRLDQLHKQGRRGDGVRVVLIDSDFTGYAPLVGKQLPARTRLIDLTAETSRDLEPLPSSTPADSLGHGTRSALALALAAPDVELILVRVDPTAPHQVLSVARSVRGEVFQTEAMRSRSRELVEDEETLARRRIFLTNQRKEVFNDFADEPDSAKRRDENTAAFADLAKQDEAFKRRVDRLAKLTLDLQSLHGVPLVVSPLVWNEGHPVDGGSYLSRSLTEKFGRSSPSVQLNAQRKKPLPIWVNAAGNSRGQSWTGLFRDADSNGLMEFAPADVSMKPGRWSAELNFMAYQSLANAQVSEELPDGATVRVAIQWREPVDPTLADPNDEYYRTPMADLRLLVVRQRDPKGEKIPSDDLELTARSPVFPQRLFKDSRQVAWEQTAEFTVPKTGGRFALMVLGNVPGSTRPPWSPTVPGHQHAWELRPRIFLEVTDAATKAKGRVVFQDYASEPGGVAMPGDSWAVLTIGSAHPTNRPEPASGWGGGPNVQMLTKPDLLAYDQLPLPPAAKGESLGTSSAASFAAGVAASLLSAGAPLTDLPNLLGIERGNVLILPEKLFAK
jgi:hypothetical protein